MIHAPIDDPALEARFKALPPEGMTIFTLGVAKGAAAGGSPGGLRGAILHGTRLVNFMRANHGLGPLETLVLGRAYLLAGLLSATIKGEDRLALRIDGDGPAAGLSVEAKADGSVRGYLLANPIPLEASPEGKDPAALWRALFGQGALTMTRYIADRPKPFSGTVALGGQGFAKDLASYYLESEQTRTAFDAGIEFDRGGRAIGAGALYLQALPGADEAFLGEVEEAVRSLPPLGLWFAEGGTRDAFIEERLGAFGPESLDEKRVTFNCGCSRAGFAQFLTAGKREVLADLVDKGPWPVEVSCQNCGTVYRFQKSELEAMRDA
jgi:molecular chaperone Hsp33